MGDGAAGAGADGVVAPLLRGAVPLGRGVTPPARGVISREPFPSGGEPFPKLGGSKGGKIRAARLTSEQRREIAQRAAHARWKKGEA
jgi:hypothetical protein